MIPDQIIDNSNKDIDAITLLLGDISNDEVFCKKGVDLINRLYKDHSTLLTRHSPHLTQLLQELAAPELFVNRKIEMTFFNQLNYKYQMDPFEPDILSQLQQDNLFLFTLEHGVNRNLEFEFFLRNVRFQLLLQYSESQQQLKNLKRLVVAMAHQCFNNEYIFYQNNEEDKLIDILEERLLILPNDFSIAMLYAMYRPLYRHPSAGIIEIDHLDESGKNAIKKMLTEPLEEERIKSLIPTYGSITSPNSLAVKQQYEENPYPRWFHFKSKRTKSIEERIKQHNPAFSWPTSFYKGQLKILVAGCGTGQHPIMVATGHPEDQILAVDLSVSSLAYAQRMALKLGITNIEFLCADLLELPRMGNKFHHIECVGVVHHMKDQKRAWASLDALLLPGGTINMGIYSKIARMQITHARRIVGKIKCAATIKEMRAFRHDIITKPEYSILLKMIQKGDFFTTSAFRDFIFHASEYQYTFSEIEGLIKEMNFRFIGFPADNEFFRNVNKRYPDTFDSSSFSFWKSIEIEYRGTAKLLTFWIQKD